MNALATTGDDSGGGSALTPLLLAFLAAGHRTLQLPLLLLASFAMIRDSSDDLPAGDPLGAWRRKDRNAKIAKHDADRAKADAVKAQKASSAPQPWPQAVPSNLPPFPQAWDYAEPPSKAIQQRAWQLLGQLWSWGSGSTVQELTDGEWITYRAEIVANGKKGVVAYRLRPGARPAAPAPGLPPTAPALPNMHTSTAPAQSSFVGPNSPSSAVPPVTVSLPPVAHVPATASSPARPILRRGSGMGALVSHQPYVIEVQQKLGISPADGKFGAHMQEVVMHFQTSRGMVPDGIVGEHTWAALDSLVDPGALPPGQHWFVDVGPATIIKQHA